MTSRDPVTLCRYHYDALDQVANSMGGLSRPAIGITPH